MPSDLDRFIGQARAERGGFFAPGRPITVARAPGWVDLLGGAAATSGALALGWPMASSTFAALQPDPEPIIRIRADDIEGYLPTEALAIGGRPREYAEIATRVTEAAPAGAAWWPTVIGAWAALLREEFAAIPGGARLLLRLADGPGAHASWAAATAQALVSAYGVRIAPRELALGCQVAAGQVGGRTGNALGPMVSVCAPAGELLLLLQQPAWHWGDLHMPHGAAIWALRVGAGPAQTITGRSAAAAAMAYRLIADAAGLTPEQADARWGGYLANIGTAAFERRYRELLPARLSGADFLARYDTPPGVEIAPAEGYPLRAAAALAIGEHLRARGAVALLRAAASKAQRDDDLLLVGEMMAESHWLQRAAGLGDAHADRLADMVDAAGPSRGLFGARAPAAASGATLVVLARAGVEDELQKIAERYARDCGEPVALFGGSAPGCSPAGTREIADSR
jgi:galactokinase